MGESVKDMKPEKLKKEADWQNDKGEYNESLAEKRMEKLAKKLKKRHYINI